MQRPGIASVDQLADVAIAIFIQRIGPRIVDKALAGGKMQMRTAGGARIALDANHLPSTDRHCAIARAIVDGTLGFDPGWHTIGQQMGSHGKFLGAMLNHHCVPIPPGARRQGVEAVVVVDIDDHAIFGRRNGLIVGIQRKIDLANSVHGIAAGDCGPGVGNPRQLIGGQ